jgi:hypothetical protein
MISINPSAIPLVYAIPIGAALMAAMHAGAGMRPRRTNTPWARLGRAIEEITDRIRERWSAQREPERRRPAARTHGMGASGR